MPNPIFNAYQSQMRPQMGGSIGPLGNMQNMMQQLNQFRQSFQGDPRARVEQLLQSGQMSQEQFDQFSNMARQFQQMIGR